MIDARELPWSVHSGEADCPARAPQGSSTAAGPPCGGRAAVAVDLRYSHGNTQATVFLCDAHGAEVPTARPMTAAEIEESDRRRENAAYWRSVLEQNRRRIYGRPSDKV